MTTTRQFRCEDLFRFNNVNLDPLTETYQMSFYLQYLSTWPDFFQAEAHPSGNLMGYVMGKAEGEGELWHGHVTAVTVAPESRATKRSTPVPTKGASVRTTGTAWRCMLEPINARFASSFSRNGTNDAATDTN